MNAATLSLVFFILFGVTALFCEGWVGGATERCLCQETKKRVKPALVQRVNIFPPSVSCSYTDIIITLKTGKKVCLDPNGQQGRRVLSELKQKKKAKTQRGKKKKNKNKQQN